MTTVDFEQFSKLAHQVSLLNAALHAVLLASASTTLPIALEQKMSSYIAAVQGSPASDAVIELLQAQAQSLMAAALHGHT